jgi:hypothetical protein
MTTLMYALVAELRIQELTSAWAMFQAELRREALNTRLHSSKDSRA